MKRFAPVVIGLTLALIPYPPTIPPHPSHCSPISIVPFTLTLAPQPGHGFELVIMDEIFSGANLPTPRTLVLAPAL